MFSQKSKRLPQSKQREKEIEAYERNSEESSRRLRHRNRNKLALNDNYKSKWFYWDRLQFLVAVMQAGKKVKRKDKTWN